MRAYSYFAADAVAPFDVYEQGYADTDHIEVAVGIAEGEGAAGSTFWRVPVAIRAYADGAIEAFSGCYTLRLAAPNPVAALPAAPHRGGQPATRRRPGRRAHGAGPGLLPGLSATNVGPRVKALGQRGRFLGFGQI